MSEEYFTLVNIGDTNDFITDLKGCSSYKKCMQKGNVIHIYIDVIDFFHIFGNWRNVLVWNKQRPINDDKVHQIYNSYKKNMGEMLYCSVSPVISIGTVRGKNPKIMDGQHRLSALELCLSNDVNTAIDIKIPFHIADYIDDNERFKAFIDINSNTQLPDLYKAFSNKDVRLSKIVESCSDIIKDLPFLNHHLIDDKSVGTMDKPRFNIEMCKTKLFSYIKNKNIDIELTDDIENKLNIFCNKFLSTVIEYNNTLKTCSVATYSTNGFINNDLCISRKNSKSKVQCNHPKKMNDRCKTHDGSQTPDCDPIFIRQTLYNNVNQTGSYILMLIDYTWISDVLDIMTKNESIYSHEAH